MEKLLKLLNEYHHFNSDLIGYFYDEEYEKFYFRTELPEEEKEKLRKANALIDDGIDETWIENEWICSKKFGFIKWLVENEKIDQREIEYKFQDVLFELEEEEIVKEKSDFLIMLLSISDTPIEDLISYLK